ncbi:hypothetical protein F4604DRAFT_1883345 [Suillus subluteus]|nr:hypothetical protein F4604DRAFT_1883345 [Suillus subluteus]
MKIAIKDQSRIHTPYVIDQGYRFPEPALLISPKLAEHLQVYLANWLASRALWSHFHWNTIGCGITPCRAVFLTQQPTIHHHHQYIEFVHLLFLRQSPNQMVWCDALETFLDRMKYKLRLKNNLWCCFSKVFHWYQVLTVLAQNHITTLVVGSWKDGACMDQPSEYLHTWRPLCFGGNDWRNGVRDSLPINAPPNPTPSFFVLMDDLKAMEDFEGMRIPVSVLNGCGDSFIAANEKQEKASTHFFTDTGLMALVCRHDRVLWIANLTSGGEKQHYALALLDWLFKHIPTQMTIGLLYNIGCQLKRSCRKWNFMDDSILSRIAFAVAVLHAYGHQWVCQIVYYPRKRKGFGLSDGKGCEWLWSFLKPLISSLRVSGFNERLFVLDTQIRHLDSKSLQGFRHWLHQCWIHCQSKKNDVLDRLHALELDENALHVEWKAQVDHQMNKAAEVITIILALEKMLQTQEASIHELEMQLHGVHVPNIGEVTALGMEDKVNLEKMKKDTYLTTHIRDHLCQRKFELERLERSYRAMVNAECKLHANTEHSIKYREPGILKLSTTYNSLCSQLQSLIQQQRAPHSAVPPHIIPCDGIFQLDVDDDIWQDIGLDNNTLNPPAWLSDDMVRNGIRLQLEVDRSNELPDICIIWKKKVQNIPCAWPMIVSWGPSEKALVQAACNQARSSFWGEDDDESLEGDREGDCESDLEYGEIEDEELMDTIEEIALADEYRYGQNAEFTDDLDDLDDIADDFIPSSPIKSLHKRRNI